MKHILTFTFIMAMPLAMMPSTVAAQLSLNITCSATAGTVTNLCDDTNMTTLEAAVEKADENAHEAIQAASANTNRISDNSTDIATNEADIASTREEIWGAAVSTTGLSRIDMNTESVATNTNRIDTNASEISTNADSITTNAGNISANADSITTNAGNISANAGNISRNSRRISTLRNDMNRGLAMTSAMEIIAPDPGAYFRLNIGAGFFDGASAFGISGTGRLNGGNTIAYIGVAGSGGAYAGKTGVSFQW